MSAKNPADERQRFEIIREISRSHDDREDLRLGAPSLQAENRARRLKEAVHSAGGPKAVSERSGVALSSLGDWMAGREIRVSAVEKLAQACGVSPIWLAFGDNPVTVAQLEPTGNDRYIPIPRYNVEASAGGGSLVPSEQIVDYLAFSAEYLQREIKRSSDQLLLITARGDSMEPTIRDGELLLVDRTPQPVASGAVHVINVEGTLLVKRIEACIDGSFLIHSDNTRYKTQSVAKSERDDLKIIGQVIWQGGPVRS